LHLAVDAIFAVVSEVDVCELDAAAADAAVRVDDEAADGSEEYSRSNHSRWSISVPGPSSPGRKTDSPMSSDWRDCSPG